VGCQLLLQSLAEADVVFYCCLRSLNYLVE
jgi:hypothetical protein